MRVDRLTTIAVSKKNHKKLKKMKAAGDFNTLNELIGWLIRNTGKNQLEKRFRFEL